MGSNYHTSYTTATKFHTDDLNVPLEDLDKKISFDQCYVYHTGNHSWDSTNGELTWSTVMKIVFPDPVDGKMLINVIASSTLTVPGGSLVYTDLSTVQGDTVTVAYAAITTASTAIIPVNRLILGVVNTALIFYDNALKLDRL